MSDIHKLTFIEKRERLKNSVFKSLHDVSEFFFGSSAVARNDPAAPRKPAYSLHAIRGKKSRGRKKKKILENVHIVRRDPEGDQLWIGFSELVTDINIAVRLPEIRDQLYEDISDCIDTARKKKKKNPRH